MTEDDLLGRLLDKHRQSTLTGWRVDLAAVVEEYAEEATEARPLLSVRAKLADRGFSGEEIGSAIANVPDRDAEVTRRAEAPTPSDPSLPEDKLREALDAAGYPSDEALVLASPSDIADDTGLSRDTIRSALHEAAKSVDWQALRDEWEERVEEIEEEREEAAQAYAADEADLEELERVQEREDEAREALSRIQAWFETEEELEEERQKARKALEAAEERRQELAQEHAETGDELEELREVEEEREEAEERLNELQETSTAALWVDRTVDLDGAGGERDAAETDAARPTEIEESPEPEPVVTTETGRNDDSGLLKGDHEDDVRLPAENLGYWDARSSGLRVYCRNDEQRVSTEKPFPLGAFLLLSMVTVGIFAVLYLPYYAFLKPAQCPMCKDSNLEPID